MATNSTQRSSYLTIDSGLTSYLTSSANINELNGTVTIGGASLTGYDFGGAFTAASKYSPVMQYLGMSLGIRKIAGGAGTPGVWTLTPTAGNGLDYTFVYQAPNNSPQYVPYTSPTAGTVTATTINNAFRTGLPLYQQVHVTATGTTTLILTGNLGFESFSIVATGSSSPNWASITNTTPGTQTALSGAQLLAIGINATSTLYYDWYQIVFNNGQPTGSNEPQLGQSTVFNLYLNTAQANLAGFEAHMASCISGLGINAVANSQLIAKS